MLLYCSLMNYSFPNNVSLCQATFWGSNHAFGFRYTNLLAACCFMNTTILSFALGLEENYYSGYGSRSAEVLIGNGKWCQQRGSAGHFCLQTVNIFAPPQKKLFERYRSNSTNITLLILLVLHTNCLVTRKSTVKSLVPSGNEAVFWWSWNVPLHCLCVLK